MTHALDGSPDPRIPCALDEAARIPHVRGKPSVNPLGGAIIVRIQEHTVQAQAVKPGQQSITLHALP